MGIDNLDVIYKNVINECYRHEGDSKYIDAVTNKISKIIDGAQDDKNGNISIVSTDSYGVTKFKYKKEKILESLKKYRENNGKDLNDVVKRVAIKVFAFYSCGLSGWKKDFDLLETVTGNKFTSCYLYPLVEEVVDGEENGKTSLM